MKKAPIFKDIFGPQWSDLPPVMLKHYSCRPYSTDTLIVRGNLDVSCKGPIKLFSALFWLLKGIPPHNEADVPCSVRFESDIGTNSFLFIREINFKTRTPYVFKSRMLQIKDSEVIEIMPYRLAWRMNYSWEDGRVKLKHKGYGLYIFGKLIPLPLSFIIGKGYAEEIAIDDNSFEMFTHITHPIWGKIYEYKGKFEVVE